jgi:hypothetical protein
MVTVTAGKDAAQQLSAFGEVTFMQLDTADKDSVARFAEQVGDKHAGSIDLLVSRTCLHEQQHACRRGRIFMLWVNYSTRSSHACKPLRMLYVLACSTSL